MRTAPFGTGVSDGCALMPALLKLIDVVEQENQALQEHRVQSDTDFADRKNQGLRELLAAQRSEESLGRAEACRYLLNRLSSALRINASHLKLHIGAVGEVSDIIIGGLRDAESDGTYSRLHQRHR
jgi:hypothetical protein